MGGETLVGIIARTGEIFRDSSGTKDARKDGTEGVGN